MRTNWNFDGKGINGGDEYMSRIATLTDHGHVLTAGNLLAAAPDLLESLQEVMDYAYKYLDLGSGGGKEDGIIERADNAIAKAKG